MKSIFLKFFLLMYLLTSSALAQSKLSDKQLSAVLSIITNSILSSSALMKAPTLAIDIPAQIAENNISIQINGIKNQKVYINGEEVGIIGTEGTLVIRLPLNMGDNSFSISLRDENNNESAILTISVERVGLLLFGYIVDNPIANATIEIYDQNNLLLFKKENATDEYGQYKIVLKDDVVDKFKSSSLLYIKATTNDKQLRGLISDFNTTNEFPLRNLIISPYTEATMRICDSLELDNENCSKISKAFYQSYENNATYNTSCSFSFNPIIEELASNIKENFYNNTLLISDDSIKEKIALLKTMKFSEMDACTEIVSLPLIEISNESISLNIVSFNKNSSDLNGSDLTMAFHKTLKTDSPFYDKSVLYTFNIENKDMVLRDVNIESFDINRTSKDIMYDSSYIEEVQDSDNAQIIENLKFKLKFREDDTLSRISRALVPKGDLTDVFYENGKAIVKIVVDYSKLTLSEKILNNYKIYLDIKLYKDGRWNSVDFETQSMDVYRQETFEFDITEALKDEEQKHIPIKITLREDNFIGDKSVLLSKIYGFIDYNNDYENATIAHKTLESTEAKASNSKHADNVWDNTKGFENQHILSTTTHRIIDFDEIVDTNIAKETSFWRTSTYVENKNTLDDNREPLLLVHGWQGNIGQTNAGVLLTYKNNEFEYWHNFISYYLATPALYERYKLYTYHYSSYKHITYNARILKELLDEIKLKDNTELGHGLNNDGIVMLVHSMGGMLSRSFIEEHKGLGEDAEQLKKLITLDTPHHGSVSTVRAYARSGGINQIANSVGFAKNLDTPGVVDMIWDNYDNKYETSHIRYKATLGNGLSSRNYRLGDNGDFDDFYSSNISQDSNKNMNPWLYNMNYKYSPNSQHLSQKNPLSHPLLRVDSP